ncbi:MAG: sulfatase-like hydrolase/transferase [Planctomycetota bacterium]
MGDPLRTHLPHRRMLITALCLALQVSAPTQAAEVSTGPVRVARPNVVILIADDFGVDLVGAYGEGASPACTENIDRLAGEGLLFRNAWAMPACSPTRASLMTGRYGFRTGIGSPVSNNDAGLLLSETTLPELLTGYASAAVGKWHLSGGQGDLHPNNSGFGRFAGSLRGGIPNYFQWRKTTDGQSGNVTTYATTDAADEAILAITTLPEPWLTYVSFNAPHTPVHAPPPNLCPGSSCANSFCSGLPANPTEAEQVKAMTEAMDQEIGRVLAVLESVDPNALVIFMGDNGTTRAATEPPFVRNHAKGTTYEGGVNVPLIIKGPGVRQGETQALVSTTDLYATLAELARVRSAAEDSVSLVPVLRDPSASVRYFVYAESFSDNGGTLPLNGHQRAVRGERYKLIRETGEADEFYDLQSDPFEANNLLPGLNAAQQAAFDALEAEFVALGVD